jgi:hypothetical protein
LIEIDLRCARIGGMQLTAEMIVQLIVLLILMALAAGTGMLVGVLLD